MVDSRARWEQQEPSARLRWPGWSAAFAEINCLCPGSLFIVIGADPLAAPTKGTHFACCLLSQAAVWTSFTYFLIFDFRHFVAGLLRGVSQPPKKLPSRRLELLLRYSVLRTLQQQVTCSTASPGPHSFSWGACLLRCHPRPFCTESANPPNLPDSPGYPFELD